MRHRKSRTKLMKALANEARCTNWRTQEDHGLCRDVRCETCPLFKARPKAA